MSSVVEGTGTGTGGRTGCLLEKWMDTGNDEKLDEMVEYMDMAEEKIDEFQRMMDE